MADGLDMPTPASLTAGNINYNSLKAMKAMEMLKELEESLPVGR